MKVVIKKTDVFFNQLTVAINTKKKKKIVKKYENQINVRSGLYVDMYSNHHNKKSLPETIWGDIKYFSPTNPLEIKKDIKNKKERK